MPPGSQPCGNASPEGEPPHDTRSLICTGPVYKLRMMPVRKGISEARRRLFELVDRVLDHPDEAVFIEHRDRAERVALVAETRLSALERRAGRVGPPRSLVCSAALVGEATVDGIVAMLRGVPGGGDGDG